MESASNLSIIFVAGAWHTDFHLSPTLPFLKNRGYRVVPATLRTNLKLEPPPTIQDNIDHIATLIRQEIDAGYQLCIIGHSASGHPCLGAVSKFLETATPAEKQKLKHVILIASFLNAVRACEGLTWYNIDFTTMWADVVDPGVFYNDMAPDAAKPFVDALVHNRVQMPADFSDAWRSVPGTFVLCKQDLAIPPERQRVEAEEGGMRIVEMEAGHCPFVSRPGELAGVVSSVLESS
ncbi:hypothetical protein Q7P37_007485 [Cladosporium fusiforme]